MNDRAPTLEDSEGPAASAAGALARLAMRDEVLQVCYWYQGEGFGDRYDAAVLRPFLACDERAIELALAELAQLGDLEREAGGCYRFSTGGRREAGRLFADAFSDFQKQGHGECDAGCCDGDDHSQCGDDCQK